MKISPVVWVCMAFAAMTMAALLATEFHPEWFGLR